MKLTTKLHLGAMGYRDVRGDSSLWAKPVGKALLAYRNSTLYLLFRTTQSKPECWQHEVLNEDEEDFPDALAGAEAMILSGTIESVLCPKGKRGFAFVDTLREVEFLLC